MLTVLSQALVDVHTVGKALCHQTHTCAAGSGKTHYVFLFQLPHCKHEPALVVYLVPCLGILVVYFSDSAVPSGPTCSAIVLPDVPKHKKPVVRLMEKMHALHRLRSGMTYTAMSPVLRNQQYMVNKVSFQRNTEETRSHVY